MSARRLRSRPLGAVRTSGATVGQAKPRPGRLLREQAFGFGREGQGDAGLGELRLYRRAIHRVERWVGIGGFASLEALRSRGARLRSGGREEVGHQGPWSRPVEPFASSQSGIGNQRSLPRPSATARARRFGGGPREEGACSHRARGWRSKVEALPCDPFRVTSRPTSVGGQGDARCEGLRAIARRGANRDDTQRSSDRRVACEDRFRDVPSGGSRDRVTERSEPAFGRASRAKGPGSERIVEGGFVARALPFGVEQRQRGSRGAQLV